MKKAGLAIIGYGGMGRFHAAFAQAHESLELLGIYDINSAPCALAEEKGLYVYPSLEAVLSDPRVELVTVAIPNHCHKEVCIRAMQAGKNVVCEKPVALDHQQLQEMIDAANENGVLFTVHQNRRWDPDFRTVKHIYDQNILGRIFRIESRVHGSRGIPGDWRNKKECGGGMILDWGVHLLDQILQITDRKIRSVYATVSYVTNEECDDGFTATLCFEDDLTVVVEVGTSNFIELPRWYVLGENGSAVIQDWQQNGKIVMVSDWEKQDAVPIVAGAGLTKTMAPRTDETIREYPLPVQDADLREFYRNAVAAIHGEQTQIVTHRELMRVMKLMEAIFESAETCRVITDFEER